MGSALPNCKFSGLLRYNMCSEGPKGLQFFMCTQIANSDLSLYLGVNDPENVKRYFQKYLIISTKLAMLTQKN